MNSRILTFLIFVAAAAATSAQVAGIFGGNANQGSTSNKWIKLGEIVLNGSYVRGTLQVDFYPDESPHGDSRQTLIVAMRNSLNTLANASGIDISIVTHYGAEVTIKDVKVVHTSGTGVTNNTLAVWVQMGASWIAHVPIEVRAAGNVTYFTTNQPFYSSIQDSGTIYGMTSTHGMYGNRFGIGTVVPSHTLHVNGHGVFKDGSVVDIALTNPGGKNGIVLSPNTYGNYQRFNMVNNDHPTAGYQFFQMKFNTDSEGLTVRKGGNIGIGTTTPTEKLSVNGTIRSQEVKVEASPWPDYVFDEDYRPPTIDYVANYIKSNKHLPEVPTAEEVQENGIAVGEMNAVLLKKIEELTLYTIEQHKEINELRIQDNELRRENEELKKQVAMFPSISKRGDRGELDELREYNKTLIQHVLSLSERVEKLERK